MNKHLFIITIILLCLLIYRPVEARLILGVVVGSNDVAGEITSAQANSLADVLAKQLSEEVVVRELSDSDTLLNWLDRFAMLDLALLPAKNNSANLSGFVQVGPVDEQEKYNLVFRRGVSVDLPQRIDKVVSEPGFEPWKAKKTEPPDELVMEEVTPSLEDSTLVSSELKDDSPLASGRTRPQEKGVVYSALSSYGTTALKDLVFGVFPDPKGLVLSTHQTEELLRYLERTMPASVKVREFMSIETFTEWFMRYRMVDLAIMSPAVAKANLGNDYIPVAELIHFDEQGKETPALVIMRHGQNEEMRKPLQRAFLDMMKTTEGQALFATLGLNKILTPEDISGRKVVFDSQPEPVTVVKKPVVELPVEPAEKIIPLAIKYTEPAKPKAPAALVAGELPLLPQVKEPDANLSVVETVETRQLILEFDKTPTQPVPPELVTQMMVPEVGVRKSAPAQPEMAQSVEIVPPVVPSGLSEVVEPAAVLPIPEGPDVLLPRPEVTAIPAEPEPPSVIEVIDVPGPYGQPHEAPQMAAPPVVEVVVPRVSSDLDTVDESLSQVSAPGVAEIAPPVVPDQPVVIKTPPELEQPETIVPNVDVVSGEQDPQPVTVAEVEIETENLISDDPVGYEQQDIITEALAFADAAPPGELSEVKPVIVDENTEAWSEEEFAAVLGEEMVAAVVSQPDLPPEFRPSGVPVVRPGRVARPTPVSEDQILVASLPEPIKKVEPPRPPKLLPDEEPEPGVVYIVPFVGVMVPEEVNTRIFDQFVDQLNQEGETLGLQFVILKGGLQRVTPEWLSVRKYVTGEIYAYIEDSSCCSTDLRTKSRLTYRRPNQKTAAFGFEYPVRRFFEHDRSSIDVERNNLSDDIAETLSGELIKALRN